MTSVMTPDGAPEVINARRTESLDAPNILKLANASTEALFGRVNVVNIIEKAVLAVTLVNEREELLGHAAFFDYPNNENVDEAKWESWLNESYDCTKCTPINTLFLHYFVAKPEYSHGCAREIIRTLFNSAPGIHYCYLLVPTGVFPDAALADVFEQLPRKESMHSNVNHVVFGCYRHQHVPVLHVRTALVEDNDDVVPLFNKQNSALKETYGEYFLAELIESQDENMQCLVAEVDGTAIGFMSLSTDVNLDLLNECFELGPFHGLRKSHENDETEPPKTPTPEQTPQQDRPASAASQQSVGSRDSRASLVSAGSRAGSQNGQTGGEQPASGGTSVPPSRKDSPLDSKSSSKAGSKPASRPQSNGSQHSDTVVRAKLSDAPLANGNGQPLLSDHSDVESVHSNASEADRRSHSHTPTPPVLEPQNTMPVSVPKTPKPLTPRAKLPKRFVPTYYGESNTFCIQLFCIDEHYEMRSGDFMQKAFELFPDRDFCVITVSQLVPEFPLLQDFVRVTPRVPSTLPQELYVFGRPGLLRSFKVRKACSKDTQQVEQVVKTLDLHENLLLDLQRYNKYRRDPDGTEIQAFVAECSGQVVGICIIRREEDIEYIRSHYNIEDFIYLNHHARTEHAHLHHFALNPVFKHHTKSFIKEVLRLGHVTSLYYPLYPPFADKEVTSGHSMVTCLSDLVPVRPRRQIIYPVDKLEVNAPSQRVLQQKETYCLNHINRKLVLEPKVIVNARIVVVGASTVGLSFLETFAFCPHLSFNNLTLISPHGIPGEMPPDVLRDQVLADNGCYTQDEHTQMALRGWINSVYGKMTAIDRKKKQVVVNGSTVVPYDHLVLCTGTQYQIPTPTGADTTSHHPTTNQDLTPQQRTAAQHMYTGDHPGAAAGVTAGTGAATAAPSNVFTINDQYDAAVMLYWVETNVVLGTGDVVVYGSTLDAYTCVQALLDLGLQPERIHLVQPPPPPSTDSKQQNLTCFNNPSVERAVGVALQELGVAMYSDHLLAGWNDDTPLEECQRVTSCSFTTDSDPLRLDCAAFISFHATSVDYHAYRAINDACLVYDGRLVIDTSFHTNDIAIRAAGPVTKFKRSYHADQWTHQVFSSKEIGTQLANEMLKLFDPTLEPELEPPEDLLKLIPLYHWAKIQIARLPGGYNYLHVHKPTLPEPIDSMEGRELITGRPGGEIDYFRLHLNQYNNIQTITCLAKQELPVGNLLCLYDVHERLLNNLVSRYEEGLINDFYSYFHEPWCMAVFHDRFADFRDEVRELLVTRPAADAPALEEKIRAMIDEDLILNKSQRKALSVEFTDSGCKRAVETRLLSYLSYNYYHIPMYAKPGMV